MTATALSCARFLHRAARVSAKLLAAAGGDHRHHREAGEVAQEVHAEGELGPAEHDGHLDDADDGHEQPLARQELDHAELGTHEPLEGLVLLLLEQRSRIAHRTEEQEHHRDAGGVHGHHGVGLVGGEEIDHVDGDRSCE